MEAGQNAPWSSYYNAIPEPGYFIPPFHNESCSDGSSSEGDYRPGYDPTAYYPYHSNEYSEMNNVSLYEQSYSRTPTDYKQHSPVNAFGSHDDENSNSSGEY